MVTSGQLIGRAGLSQALALMSPDTALSLQIGIPASLIASLYAVIVISRYLRFSELRTELLRLVRSIEHIYGRSPVVKGEENTRKMLLVASDLIYFGHKRAAAKVFEISQDLSESSIAVNHGRLAARILESKINAAQESLRRLPKSHIRVWTFGRL